MQIKNFKNDNLFVYANSDGDGFRYFKEEAVEKLLLDNERLELELQDVTIDRDRLLAVANDQSRYIQELQ